MRADLIRTSSWSHPLGVRVFGAPLGLKVVSVVSIGLMLAGASYCFLLGLLIDKAPTGRFALAWAAVTLLPWLAAWETSKCILRRLVGRNRRAVAVAGVMILALAWSGIGEWLLLMPPSFNLPVLAGLHAVRHLPEMMIVGLLTVMASYAAASPDKHESEPRDALGYEAQIVWVRSAGNYVEFKIGGSIKVRRMTLKEVEGVLDPSRFGRINRFVVINRAHVVGERKGSRIRMSDGSEHKVGDAYRAALDGAAFRP